jgi:hypothetical protein
MAIQIQLRRDTAANWTSVNPTLAQGEIGFETDTIKLKIGDGTTAWNSLTYFGGGGATVFTDLTDVPNSYTGCGGCIVAVNGAETGLEFIAAGGSMVYPSAGIALSTGSAWDTSITDNSSNWNTAYSWGDHSLAGYLTDAPSDNKIYGRCDGTWAEVTGGVSYWTYDNGCLFPANTTDRVLVGLASTSDTDTPLQVYNASNAVGQVAIFDGIGQDGANHELYLTVGCLASDGGGILRYAKDTNIFSFGIHGHSAPGFSVGIDAATNPIVMVSSITDDLSGALLQTPSLSINSAYQFPSAIGSSGCVLASPASGTMLEWVAAGSGSQTPWTQDIDADNYALIDVACISFDTGAFTCYTRISSPAEYKFRIEDTSFNICRDINPFYRSNLSTLAQDGDVLTYDSGTNTYYPAVGGGSADFGALNAILKDYFNAL